MLMDGWQTANYLDNMSGCMHETEMCKYSHCTACKNYVIPNITTTTSKHVTVFEKIKSMNIDEFAEWFDEHCSHDTDPCITWWNNNYCKKCDGVIGHYEDSDRKIEFSYCELYDKCRFFQDLDEVPDTKQMTKLWLESEVKND